MSDAAHLVNEKRPFSCPNVGFLKQLRTYEKETMRAAAKKEEEE